MQKLPSKQNVICIIPARLHATRLPRKMLARFGEKTLLHMTYESACKVKEFSRIAIAVDHPELYEHALSFGAEVWMTSPDCKSGTERLVELCKEEKLQGDIWVNWQGDEPFIDPTMISSLLQSTDNFEEKIWTLRKKIEKKEDLLSPHIVKVICDARGRALYFSRASIPFSPHIDLSLPYYKHIGIYAYRSSVLKEFGTLSYSPLEKAESLEQLHFLFHGFSIQTHETCLEVLGVNTEEELSLARHFFYNACLKT